MGNKKKSDGVIATIERLTGDSHCPTHLRNCLNKYLYEPGMFEGGRKSPTKRQGKLVYGETDALVRNALDLDTVFRGDTTTVSKIILGSISEKELHAKLDAAQKDIHQRLDAYAYWAQRMEQLKEVLVSRNVDLKVEHLGAKLDAIPGTKSYRQTTSFALRAVQELERVETRGRLSKLTAKELTEQADAYLALDDLGHASEKARAALEVDKSYPRAWFIRVMVALRQRNTAVHEMQRQDMIGTEIAEPMSSQERMARERSDEESNRAAHYNEILDQLLPHALLHWPKSNSWCYDHNEQRTVVRDLFINQAFIRAISGGGRTNFQFLDELNGFSAERAFQNQRGPSSPWRGTFGESRLPFNEVELQVLELLVKEKDKYPSTFFCIGDACSPNKDFKLLHLRWVLKLGGYQQHWAELNERFTKHPDLYLERVVLGDALLSRLWYMHTSLNDGGDSITVTLDLWHKQKTQNLEANCYVTLLEQYGWLFHHLYVRHQFAKCAALARRLQGIDRGVMTGHPIDEGTVMPVGHSLYWRYLEALCVIHAATKDAEHLTDEDIELLLNAESLAQSFQDVEKCFWVETQEWGEGCFEDLQLPPYDIDLRDTEAWKKALQAVLALPKVAHNGALKSVADRIDKLERPFAPKQEPVSILDFAIHCGRSND